MEKCVTDHWGICIRITQLGICYITKIWNSNVDIWNVSRLEIELLKCLNFYVIFHLISGRTFSLRRSAWRMPWVGDNVSSRINSHWGFYATCFVTQVQFNYSQALCNYVISFKIEHVNLFQQHKNINRSRTDVLPNWLTQIAVKALGIIQIYYFWGY